MEATGGGEETCRRPIAAAEEEPLRPWQQEIRNG